MSTARLKSVNLPSGAVVTLRPMHAEELNLVARMAGGAQKRVNKERYDGLINVLQNCTVAVESQGPFKSFTWVQSTDGDQMVGIFALRSLTFGTTYPMKAKCEHCGAKYDATPTLLPTEEGGDLTVIPMSDEAKAALANGTCVLAPFVLPSGTTVEARLIAGPQRKEATKLIEELAADPIIAGIRARVVKMTLPDGTPVEPLDLTKAVRSMEAVDVPAFKDYIADVDGGLDDYFPLTCTECGEENEESPMAFFGEGAFWGLSQKRRKPR